MSEADAVLEEANRRAHAVAKAATELRRVAFSSGPFRVALTDEFHKVLEAARAYEEIERRAQAKPEGTG